MGDTVRRCHLWDTESISTLFLDSNLHVSNIFLLFVNYQFQVICYNSPNRLSTYIQCLWVGLCFPLSIDAECLVKGSSSFAFRASHSVYHGWQQVVSVYWLGLTFDPGHPPAHSMCCTRPYPFLMLPLTLWGLCTCCPLPGMPSSPSRQSTPTSSVDLSSQNASPKASPC
jgi:hypothetical protein